MRRKHIAEWLAQSKHSIVYKEKNLISYSGPVFTFHTSSQFSLNYVVVPVL